MQLFKIYTHPTSRTVTNPAANIAGEKEEKLPAKNISSLSKQKMQGAADKEESKTKLYPQSFPQKDQLPPLSPPKLQSKLPPIKTNKQPSIKINEKVDQTELDAILGL